MAKPKSRKKNKATKATRSKSKVEMAPKQEEANNIIAPAENKEVVEDTATAVKEPALLEEGTEPEEDDKKKKGIFDIPPELRNRIYAMGFEGNSTELAAIRFPSLLRASRQVRHEALAHFFAETEFVVYVGSDFLNWWRQRKNKGTHHSGVTRENALAGTLGLTPQARYYICKVASQHAFFRYLTFKVYFSDWVGHVQPYVKGSEAEYREESIRYNLSCKWTLEFRGDAASKLKSKKRNGPEYPADSNIFFSGQDIDDAVAAAEKLAYNVTAQDGFKGFTLHDLEHIAKGFCAFPNETGKKDDVLRDRRKVINYKE